MLEVDVDIGRFAPLGADEALEQQLGANGVDRGNAEHIADRAIRRRAAPLAEDFAAARLGDDRMDRQEIGGVIELADQFELMLELRPDLAFDALGVALRRLLPRQALEFLLRRAASTADLVGILIAQFLEAEGAAVANSTVRATGDMSSR